MWSTKSNAIPKCTSVCAKRAVYADISNLVLFIFLSFTYHWDIAQFPILITSQYEAVILTGICWAVVGGVNVTRLRQLGKCMGVAWCFAVIQKVRVVLTRCALFTWVMLHSMSTCHLHSTTIIRAAFIPSEAVLARSALPWPENSAYQLCATGVLKQSLIVAPLVKLKKFSYLVNISCNQTKTL